MTPLSITGLGVLAPSAASREELFRALSDPRVVGRETFGRPTTFESAQYGEAWVSEVRDFDPTAILGDKGLRNLDRLTKLFLVAARGVLDDSGIKRGGEYRHYDAARVGVCASTAYGSLEAMMELNRVAILENPRYLNPSKFPNTVINAALGYVSIWDDIRALNTTVCNGNCGALDAVLVAETYLASGRADAILVGGAEAMHEGLYLAFDRLESLATRGMRYEPGARDSEGMRLGEGALLVALERTTSALERGATELARVDGYGTAFEPPESEALLVHVDTVAITRSIRAALEDAGIGAGDIDLVVSCANGIVRFDAAEFDAVTEVLGAGVPIAAPKVLFGETLGASGAFAMGAAIAWFHGVTPAPMIRGTAPRDVRRVLVMALGFYGNSSAVVLRCPG